MSVEIEIGTAPPRRSALSAVIRGHRWYEPHSGRFLSEDPIGLSGGINPYTFAAGDPVNASDPTGLEQCYYYDNDLTLPGKVGVQIGHLGDCQSEIGLAGMIWSDLWRDATAPGYSPSLGPVFAGASAGGGTGDGEGGDDDREKDTLMQCMAESTQPVRDALSGAIAPVGVIVGEIVGIGVVSRGHGISLIRNAFSSGNAGLFTRGAGGAIVARGMGEAFLGFGRGLLTGAGWLATGGVGLAIGYVSGTFVGCLAGVL